MVGRSRSRGLPAEHERVGLDTNLFIYFLEDHPRYGAWCASLFDLIDRGRTPAVTSTVTLLELLVQPEDFCAIHDLSRPGLGTGHGGGG